MSDVVYRPVGTTGVALKPLARRSETLRGLRVAILDNCKEFADQVVAPIAEVLKRDYGVRDVSLWKKGYPGKPAPFHVEMAAQSEAVVNGVGH